MAEHKGQVSRSAGSGSAGRGASTQAGASCQEDTCWLTPDPVGCRADAGSIWCMHGKPAARAAAQACDLCRKTGKQADPSPLHRPCWEMTLTCKSRHKSQQSLGPTKNRRASAPGPTSTLHHAQPAQRPCDRSTRTAPAAACRSAGSRAPASTPIQFIRLALASARAWVWAHYCCQIIYGAGTVICLVCFVALHAKLDQLL